LSIDGVFAAFTIERVKKGLDPSNVHPCIPEGIYDLGLYASRHWTPITGHNMIMVMEVPDRSDILLHPANRADQLLGCIAPGNAVDATPGRVANVSFSRIAYEHIYAPISDAIRADGATIVITELS
jgi:hypothetical protein